MTSIATEPRTAQPQLSNPTFQAFALLRVGFTAAPILFGLDKFAELLADWSTYLWPSVASVLPGTADQIMLAVGVVEIAAGILVAVRPRIGGYVVAAWLATIIVNLLALGDFYDIALRDFGLMLGALTLARLATAFPAVGFTGRARS
ncbi:MAG: hypothetical protein R3320_03345 [Nitriliruptorales bacterium]|nr:hypothetical protein [Nitriliruptorales bacterium]